MGQTRGPGPLSVYKKAAHILAKPVFGAGFFIHNILPINYEVYCKVPREIICENPVAYKLSSFLSIDFVIF